MPYRVTLRPRAVREMRKLDRQTAERISRAIDDLAYDPRPSGCRKLVGVDAWRIRVGDWRVIYQIHDDRLVVLVVSVGHRREVYD